MRAELPGVWAFLFRGWEVPAPGGCSEALCFPLCRVLGFGSGSQGPGEVPDSRQLFPTDPRARLSPEGAVRREN